MNVSRLNATVLENTVLSPGLFLLRIKPDAPIPDFLPGQYVALGLPAVSDTKQTLLKRAYSIASSPLEKEGLEFYIANVEEGLLSPRLLALRPGDRIFAQKRYVGTFTTDSISEGSEVFLVSTGTGIAPYISMLRTPSVVERFSKITLLHGVRYARDLAYRDEILQYRQEGVPLHYLPTVSREKPPIWSGAQGYVQQFFQNGILEVCPERDHIFLCGNPDMISELRIMFEEKGFQEHARRKPGNLHYEKYW